jgi:transcription initiation protein SPT3
MDATDQARGDNKAEQISNTKVRLPWDVTSLYSEKLTDFDNVEDLEDDGAGDAGLEHLKIADERTSVMTREEYAFWSECRHASFTFRNRKKFLEFSRYAAITDSKPNDDVIDILGFLTSEIVQTITKKALEIKERNKTLSEKSNSDFIGQGNKRKRDCGLFDPSDHTPTSITPCHIQDAFQQLQRQDLRAKRMRGITTRLSAQNSSLVLV